MLAAVAGEASGDLLGSLVLRALRERGVAARSAGIGGPRMAAEGFDAWWPAERLAVRGVVEVLGRLPQLLRIRRQLRQRLLAAPPRLFLGIDAPDFNLGLEQRLRAAGIATVHFISPSIWAWRRERVHRIREAVGEMLCVFPFEPQAYEGTGVRATYVGHPLADVIPQQPDRARARAALGLAADRTVIALLPGSREAEVRYLLPAFLQAASLLRRQLPDAAFMLPVAAGELRGPIERQCAAHRALDLQVIDGRAHEVMEACNGALVASGTATLECALYRRPMVIAYRMPWLSWQLLKRRNYLPYVGLPNILSGQWLVPELLQHDCTPPALAQALLAQLRDDAQLQRYERSCEAMHAQLRLNCAQRVADVLARYL